MATLTDEQTDFIKSHHIPLDKTFDASGLSSKEYKAKMKENGALVATVYRPAQKVIPSKTNKPTAYNATPKPLHRSNAKPLQERSISPSHPVSCLPKSASLKTQAISSSN